MSNVEVDPAVCWPETLPPALLRLLSEGWPPDPDSHQEQRAPGARLNTDGPPGVKSPSRVPRAGPDGRAYSHDR